MTTSEEIHLEPRYGRRGFREALAVEEQLGGGLWVAQTQPLRLAQLLARMHHAAPSQAVPTAASSPPDSHR